SDLYSTAPPPIVPQMRPPRPPSHLAPAPRGVAPEEATTVTMTSSSPALRRSAIVLNMLLISVLHPFRRYRLSSAPTPGRPPAAGRARAAPPRPGSGRGSRGNA